LAASDILAIWNAAIGNIGVKTSIAALTEQSAEAAACALHYQRVVESVLRSKDWNRVRLTKALVDITEDFAPPARWAFRYEFPENCIAFRRLENPAGVLWNWQPDPAPIAGFEVAMDLDPDNSDRPTTYVYSDWADLVAIYTTYAFDVANGYYEALFDPALRDALSWALSAAIAAPLTGNAQLIAMARAESLRKIDEAAAASANENAPTTLSDAVESIAVRGYGDERPYRVNW
jgi:hypothetical protein